MLALLLCACPPSDHGLNEPVEEQEVRPAIAFSPGEIWFPDALPEQQVTEQLTISNEGNASLEVQGVRVTGSSTFTVLDATLPAWLSPGGSLELTVAYLPATSLDEGILEVSSDDPAQPLIYVPMFGEGLIPELEIDPDPCDYGEVVMGCAQERTIALRSVGGAALELDALAVTGTGFELVEVPSLPLSLEPGEESEVVVSLAPVSEIDHQGELWLATNEPVGERFTDLAGEGTRSGERIQTWRQPDGPWEQSDILFTVDQSGSMSDNQRNLSQNFELFISTLDTYVNDYQVMVVTQDNGCHNGSIITPDTPSPVETFGAAVQGRGGVNTEAGLSLVLAALTKSVSGGCNEGFLREDAKIMGVMVSDEPEQSRRNWSELVDDILAVEDSTALSAIAGPVPGGCPTADPGTGYDEAVMATGGLFLSICEEDWGDGLHDLAVLVSDAPTDTFVLEGFPVVQDTIEVEVDEVAATTGWSFDEDENAVIFEEASIPDPGAWIEITYVIDCAGV